MAKGPDRAPVGSDNDDGIELRLRPSTKNLTLTEARQDRQDLRDALSYTEGNDIRAEGVSSKELWSDPVMLKNLIADTLAYEEDYADTFLKHFDRAMSMYGEDLMETFVAVMDANPQYIDGMVKLLGKHYDGDRFGVVLDNTKYSSAYVRMSEGKKAQTSPFLNKVMSEIGIYVLDLPDD